VATETNPAGELRRILGTFFTALGVILLMFIGIRFLALEDGPETVLSWLYRRIGLSGEADAIDQLGMNPVMSKLIIAAVALTLGIAGIWALFIVFNKLVELLPERATETLRPWVFLLPALFLLSFYLLLPGVLTIRDSFTLDGGFVENYKWVFTDPDTRLALRNNVIWLIFGTGGAVLFGLTIAILVDRVRFERTSKTLIFIPMAISMVGASVIWRFMYWWQPEGETQIGLVNAMWTRLGNAPVAFMQTIPLNTFALILVMVWLMTGFAMVILSAAIKAVPQEMIEAARIDGATEVQIFFRVIMPNIKPSIITVTTTIFIAILKVFDIVFVMTGGSFDTDVIANRMFTEMFKFRSFGRASALAVVLLIAVIPIMVINVRNLKKQGINA
jgi:alpha-glucoside transport system permease protein